MTRWYVNDVMNRDVPSVRADTPHGRIAELLTTQNIGTVPVVDDKRQIIGVVSVTDLVSGRAHQTATARDLMGPCPSTLQPDTPLAEAGHRLDLEKAPYSFVADSTGRLAGVVSRQDLLGSSLRDDREVQEDVAEKVLWRALGLDPLAVQAAVNRGIVDLSGKVQDKSVADIAVALTGAVPGVAKVVNRLRWDQANRPLKRTCSEEFLHIGHVG